MATLSRSCPTAPGGAASPRTTQPSTGPPSTGVLPQRPDKGIGEFRSGPREAADDRGPRGPGSVAAGVGGGGGGAIVVGGAGRDAETVAGVVKAPADAFGGLDVLINNAGDLLGRHPLAEVADVFVLDVFSVNVMSAIAASR